MWEKRLALPFIQVEAFPNASSTVYTACHFSAAHKHTLIGWFFCVCLFVFNDLDSCQPTGEGFVDAASDGDQVLDDVLAAGRLAAAAAAQENNGLILACGEEAPVRSLGHAVDVRGRVFPPAAFEHLHHLQSRPAFLHSAAHRCVSSVCRRRPYLL